MAKYTPSTISSGYNSNSTLNTNLENIATELNDKVLYRNNPVGEPNTMENDLDMNSNDILNVNALDATEISINGSDVTTFVGDSQAYAAEWANKAEDSLVSTAAGGDGVDDYSALHHATKASSSAAAASASEVAAAASETAAAASAATATAAADSVIWNDVQFKTFSDTPITISQSDDGALISVDTSGGNVVINLPSIAALTLPFTIGIKKSTGDANTITINRNGTDTIEAATSYVLSAQDDGITLIPDIDPTPDKWSLAAFGSGVSTSGNNTWSGDNEFGAGAGKLTRGGAEVATVDDLPTVTQIQSITGTVAANALTVGLAATTLAFRNATLTNGAPTEVVIESPLSLVVPSGATLGTVNAVQSRLVLLAINNAGTAELAIVNLAGGNNLDETTLISTTAIDAAADSDNIIYSTTARTNVPFRVIGFVESTQATAGAWATSPSTLQGAGGNALTTMSSMGYGQTWQDVTGSRTFSTTYYNTTGKPITVAISASVSVSNINCIVGGVTLSSGQPTSSNIEAQTFIVPPSSSYSITYAGTMNIWAELR
jgi:hypothetical protein